MLSISEVLKKTGSKLETALKKNSPYRTGALRRSIKESIKGNTIQISLYRYGEILNRGTKIQKYKGWIGEVFDIQVPQIKKELIDAFKSDIIFNIRQINQLK